MITIFPKKKFDHGNILPHVNKRHRSFGTCIQLFANFCTDFDSVVQSVIVLGEKSAKQSVPCSEVLPDSLSGPKLVPHGRAVALSYCLLHNNIFTHALISAHSKYLLTDYNCVN